MTRRVNRDPKLVPVIRQQVDRITSAFANEQITIGTEYAADHGVSYMYAEGQLLVREKDLERVQAILGQPAGIDHVEHVIADVVLLRLVEAKGRANKIKVRPGAVPRSEERRVGKEC